MINNAGNSVASLESYVARAGIADEQAETKFQQGQVRSASKERKQLSAELNKVQSAADKLERKAQKAGLKAAKTRLIARMVGVGAVRKHKAHKLSAKADRKGADAKAIELKVTIARKAAEQGLDRMREAISQMNQIVDSIKTNTRDRDR